MSTDPKPSPNNGLNPEIALRIEFLIELYIGVVPFASIDLFNRKGLNV